MGVNQSLKILIAEDDDDDFLLAEDTLREIGVAAVNIQRVLNGQELINHLQENTFKPDLILLDLNMPIKSGREALREIRTQLNIPTSISILSTSDAQEDIDYCYKHGANSYVVKSGSLSLYTNKMRSIIDFWANVAELPRLIR